MIRDDRPIRLLHGLYGRESEATMPPVLRSGTVFCLKGMTQGSRIYTKGDGNYGTRFSVVDTPTPPSLGGDDVYWGSFPESEQGQSWLILAPEWAQDETEWTIFGVTVRLGTNWPPHTLGGDIKLVEILGAGNVQAGIYLEATSGDVYLVDSTGAQAISHANPLFADEPFLIIAAVQLQDPGDSKLYIYNMEASPQGQTNATGNNFKTASGLTLTVKLQGQNHGGSPLANPTLTLMMNPFVMDGSTDPVNEMPRRMAGLFWTCSDGDATPPFQYDGLTTSPQVATDGVWSDTADESGGTDVEYSTAGNGGMNVVDGPKDDSRLGPSTKIFGGGVCIHTDAAFFSTSTDVVAGRYPGSGSVLDRRLLQGATYGGTGINHGTTLIVDNLVYGDQLVAGHQSNLASNFSKINAMRGWALVDWNTFATGVQEVGPGVYQAPQVVMAQ